MTLPVQNDTSSPDRSRGIGPFIDTDLVVVNNGRTVGDLCAELIQAPAAGDPAEAADRRSRAYTQLMVAYEDAQLAVAYLRGTKYDADTIIPNLHPGRPGARKKASGDSTQVPPGSVPPPAPGSAPGAAAVSDGTASTPVAAPSGQDAAFISKNGPFAS